MCKEYLNLFITHNYNLYTIIIVLRHKLVYQVKLKFDCVIDLIKGSNSLFMYQDVLNCLTIPSLWENMGSIIG